jgi:hypothetical protein
VAITRHGVGWNDENTAKLLQLAHEDYEQIAIKLGKSRHAVRQKLIRSGVYVERGPGGRKPEYTTGPRARPKPEDRKPLPPFHPIALAVLQEAGLCLIAP